MGHVSPDSTAVYLTITPQLLERLTSASNPSPHRHGGGDAVTGRQPLGPADPLLLYRPPHHGEGPPAGVGAQLPGTVRLMLCFVIVTDNSDAPG